MNIDEFTKDELSAFMREMGRKGGATAGKPKGFSAMSAEECERVRRLSAAHRKKFAEERKINIDSKR